MRDCSSRSQSKSEQILNAAVEEFLEKGYAATNMDRVSERAHVSKRTLYKYFESKEKLFHSIVKELVNRFARGLDVRFEPGQPIRDQLTSLAWAEGRLLIADDVMAMTRIVICESIRHPELDEIARGQVNVSPIFETFFRAAAEHGQLTVSSPADAAQEFIALIKSKSFWPVVFGAPIVSEADMAKIVDNCVEMIMCRYGRV